MLVAANGAIKWHFYPNATIHSTLRDLKKRDIFNFARHFQLTTILVHRHRSHGGFEILEVLIHITVILLSDQGKVF